jgi:hypothetical protein
LQQIENYISLVRAQVTHRRTSFLDLLVDLLAGPIGCDVRKSNAWLGGNAERISQEAHLVESD